MTEYKNETAEKLVSLLKKKNMIISTAESCTGGLIGAEIVSVPGASDVFMEGYITYANEIKIRELGVKRDTLFCYGAVSEECAKEMAEGLLKKTGCDIAVVSTGIAGPGGGTEEKPVGLVYIGIALKGAVVVLENHFQGDRQMIRRQTVERALKEVTGILEEEKLI